MSLKLPIYMDYHATTPLDPRVLNEMLPFFKEKFGNASSVDHPYGAVAHDAVERARERVARLIHAKPEEIIFTSGATEADNLALIGTAISYRGKGQHIITCTTEHKAVLDTCKYLEQFGWKVSYIPVNKLGEIDLERLNNAICPETVLISVMFANNEIGTIGSIREIGNIAKAKGIIFHTDAAQAVGHIPVDVEEMSIDLMSMSAHKINGPKGIGALYVRRHDPRVVLSSLIHGGGQERNLRSGTQNVPGIVGMGSALEIARKSLDREASLFMNWTSRMKSAFNDISDAEQNGHPTNKLPHNLNMYFPKVESKALIQAVNKEVAISAGSACTSQEVEPSHVILSLGYPAERAHSSVRFGVGRFNTVDEVKFVIECVNKAISHIRKIGV